MISPSLFEKDAGGIAGLYRITLQFAGERQAPFVWHVMQRDHVITRRTPLPATEGSRMKHQQGAALVIVMALLSAALLLGVASMRTALVDERLAGNFRIAVQAQMLDESLWLSCRTASMQHRGMPFLNRLLTYPPAFNIGDKRQLKAMIVRHYCHPPGAQRQLLEALPIAQAEGQRRLLDDLIIDIERLADQRVAITARSGGAPASTHAVFVRQSPEEATWRLAGLR